MARRSFIVGIPQDGRVTYFNGSMPVFVHEEADLDSYLQSHPIAAFLDSPDEIPGLPDQVPIHADFEDVQKCAEGNLPKEIRLSAGKPLKEAIDLETGARS